MTKSPSAPLSVDHYENFPVAGLLCPRPIRAAIVAIYAWARAADDIADEPGRELAERLALLAALRAQLPATDANSAQNLPTSLNLQSSPNWPNLGPNGLFRSSGFGADLPSLPAPLAAIAAQLNAAIARHNIAAQPFHDLLSAFEHDVLASAHGYFYADRAALLTYCRHSAAPVGRLVLHLWGVRDAQSVAQSDAICAALQLINFWQDASVDLPRQRYYLPERDCADFALDARTIASNSTQINAKAVQPLFAALLDWAEQCMHEGQDLALRLKGRPGWQLRLVVQGGLRMARKIRAQNGENLHQRQKLNMWDWFCVIFKACTMRKISAKS